MSAMQVSSSYLISLPQLTTIAHREFDPSWNAVAKAWATAPRKHKDTHFFATLDFDNGQSVFQKVC